MPEIPQTNKVPSHPIVVHCPSFEENSGGAIVLHYLVDRLRAYGVEAYAWPLVKHNNHDADIKQYGADIPGWWRKLRILNQKRRRIRKEKRAEYNFVTHPSMNVPVASESILRRSIAVYPEIVSGNPLGAPYIVRWLLHRPDFFGAGLDLDLNEIVFYYQKAFKEGVPWVDPDNMLCIRWIRDDVYYDRKLGGRSGSCRMIRKAGKQALRKFRREMTPSCWTRNRIRKLLLFSTLQKDFTVMIHIRCIHCMLRFAAAYQSSCHNRD